jgi:hypothetical protein
MQVRICLRLALTATLAAGIAAADDVSFDQTMKFTGGSMVEMMKRMANNPMLGRKGGGFAAAFQDQNFKVYVKGSKMARIGSISSSIMDVDAGTMTIINNERHTYSTQTFDQMRQRMEEMQARMSHGQPGGDLQFDVKVDKTAQTRNIDGKTAIDTVLTLTAKSSGANGQMVVKVDAWVIEADQAMQDVRDYYRRLSQKFAYAFAGSPGLGSAGAGINAAYRELMKLDGYPVVTDIAVSGVASPMGAGGDPNAPMITMETQSTNFAVGPVDDSKFAIPAGYTQEQGPMGGGRPQ